MPWKLIGILVILVLFLLFSGFNVHKVTIYFGPIALADVPLFVIIITSFILGAFIALPFSIIRSVNKAKKMKKKLEDKTQIDQKKGEGELIQGPEDQQNLTETDKNIRKEEKKKHKTRKK